MIKNDKNNKKNLIEVQSGFTAVATAANPRPLATLRVLVITIMTEGNSPKLPSFVNIEVWARFQA